MTDFAGNGFCFPLGKRTYIMGVLNVTPDSFSDGGAYLSPQEAVQRALCLEAEGADILDVGAESTAPGREEVPPPQEIERLREILPALCRTLKIPVSVDTRHAETAVWALSQGAAIINDVSGVFDPAMAQAVRDAGAGWIVTHGRDADQSGSDNPLPEIHSFFAQMLRMAAQSGIDARQICLDPGIGFGKSRAGDLAVLRGLRLLRTGENALLVGASRKRVIGAVSGETDAARRLSGTVACHTAAIAGGADFVRVHDVAEGLQAARVADALYRLPPVESVGLIELRDLEIFAYHGVNEPEQIFGQCFLIDVDLETDFAPSSRTDDLGKTVSYAKAAKTLRRALTESRYDLIETAAQAAADALLREYPAVRRVRLRLKKPDAPMQSKCAYAAVEIERKRS